MSMNARFVAVSPELLNELLRDPAPVAELFDGEPAPSLGAIGRNPQMQQRLQAMGPQLLEAAMTGLKPDQREAIARRLAALGVSTETFKAGTGGAALGKLMAERAENRQTSARAAGAGPSITLGKSWHGIHFLLCGEAEPGAAILSQMVMGGVELGEDEYGYGPARYLTADQIAEIARELAGVGLEAEMKARFDPARMTTAGIYPTQWQPADLDWLMDGFRELREFFAAASRNQLAVITCIV